VSSPGSCSRCQRALPAEIGAGLCLNCRRAAVLAPPRPVPAGAAARTPADAGPGATQTRARAADLDDLFPDARLVFADAGRHLPEAPPGYDLVCRLGAGGMGTVYLAREHAAERTVAMKVLNSPSSPPAFERFLVEARVLARLDHPNIVKVFAVETNWREPFLTMEYAAGGTLADLARPAPADAARLALAAADAVTAAHAAGILHRDIKPSNILLQSPPANGHRSADDSVLGTPKVSDFGLAKRTDRDDGLTQTGPLGTPCYMSPEAAAGRFRDIGPTADVYGLGATLYYLLTGQPPFAGAAPEEIIQKVVGEAPVRPRTVCPDVPAALEGVVVKAMEKDPAARYPTAAAFAADLRRFLAGEAPHAPVLSRLRRGRRWLARNRKRLGAAAGTVLIAAALVAAGRYLRADPPPPLEPDQAIRNEIATGQKVRLIGPDGRPRWTAWPLGPADLVPNPADGGTCSFQATDIRVLLLLNDPGVESYRVEAEIWQRQKLVDVVPGSDKNTNEVGLVLGYAGQDGADGARVHSMMPLLFTDYDPGDGPAVRRHLQLMDLGLVSPPGLQPRNLETVHGVPAMPLPRDGREWRRVAVEVTPAGVRVPGRNGRPQLANVAGIAARRNGPLGPNEKSLADMLAPTAGPVTLPDWSPRMPIGIYCRESWVYLRNVTIESLP
jgi:eukaryotic-like serine/threonine-protein kinase